MDTRVRCERITDRRGLDMERMMVATVHGLIGRHLPYADLIADGPAAVKRAAELADLPSTPHGHPF